MIKRFVINAIYCFALMQFTMVQAQDLSHRLLQAYPGVVESSLKERRITHKDIAPLIKNLQEHKRFKVKRVGESIEGRDLHLISIGTGDVDVFLWSQMHGDESTATMAIFDIFNFFKQDIFSEEKESLLKKVKLHFLPMLNPDGAEVFQRRNTLGIDVNRDALRLQSSEGILLKKIRDSLNADFGFNLHDQSKYYNVEGTSKPATISFLAPAYDFEKSVNQTRGDAMRLIVGMNRELQKVIPGQVAKYNDDFEPRAFGDNIQKWGTSTILIESGGLYNDPEKQEIRKLNFMAILTAIFSISNKEYQLENIEEYSQIPENDSKLFDLKLTGIKYNLKENKYLLDLGINYREVPGKGENKFHYQAFIADQGDLSTHYGYTTVEEESYEVVPGKIYPEVIEDVSKLKDLNLNHILEKGYTYIKVRNLPLETPIIAHPIMVVDQNFKGSTLLAPGINPTFFLYKDDQPVLVVINGFLYNWKEGGEFNGNGLLLR